MHLGRRQKQEDLQKNNAELNYCTSNQNVSDMFRFQMFYVKKLGKMLTHRGVMIPSCHDSIHITILNSRYNIIAILQDIKG